MRIEDAAPRSAKSGQSYSIVRGARTAEKKKNVDAKDMKAGNAGATTR
jgi:hypothetical protein